MPTQNKSYISNLWILIICAIIAGCIFLFNNTTSLKLKTGDLLFQDLDSSPLCDAIEKVTFGFNDLNFSHIGIVKIIDNREFVLEAFINGVDTISLDKFLNRSLNQSNQPKVIVGRFKKKYTYLIPKAINQGMKLIGKKYDNEFEINNNKFYCSELIYEIFLKANSNNPVFDLNPMTYKYNGKIMEIWKKYFENLNIPIPENEPGINPGAISLSKKIDIIYNYMEQ